MKTDFKHNIPKAVIPKRKAVLTARSLRFISALRFLAMLLLLIPAVSQAQEIRFGSYGTYTIELDNVTMGDLIFEGPINPNGGIYKVELIDSEVISILGVKYLDVDVEITGDGKLYLDGDPSHGTDPERFIPFTLQAAYANNGENNISSSVPIAIASTPDTNYGDTRFPILSRRQQPPGPPPTPPTGEFDQSLVNENAYLYLYGEIDVGNVVAGNYMGTITITVEYR